MASSSDEDVATVGPAPPQVVRIGAMCPCGWGHPPVPLEQLGELHADFLRHLPRRHPTATSFSVNLLYGIVG